MKNYDFKVILATGTNMSEELADRLFKAGCDDGTPGTFCGIPNISFHREAKRPGSRHPQRRGRCSEGRMRCRTSPNRTRLAAALLRRGVAFYQMRRTEMTGNQERRDIDGVGRTIWEMFNNRRYAIDTYQREYKWQTKQVVELLEDLSGKFMEDYAVDQERSEVAHYGHYFLGSIILSQKNGVGYIIDGQQRLTTLTVY